MRLIILASTGFMIRGFLCGPAEIKSGVLKATACNQLETSSFGFIYLFFIIHKGSHKKNVPNCGNVDPCYLIPAGNSSSFPALFLPHRRCLLWPEEERQGAKRAKR